jgi:hypothetical protein
MLQALVRMTTHANRSTLTMSMEKASQFEFYNAQTIANQGDRVSPKKQVFVPKPMTTLLAAEEHRAKHS